MSDKKLERDVMIRSMRALDLTESQSFFCGKLLADLGVDVIKVEKPLGEPTRNTTPFYQGKVDAEHSLYWMAYNANKKGITLDIETRDGKELFKKLVSSSDFVIESFPSGYMDKLGLGYSVLSNINKGIILASITPFGSVGPYKDFKSCELINMAMSGLMNLSGDADRPPVAMSFPHACLHASAQAAVALLAAAYWRKTSGEGQHIDISIRESIIQMIAQPIAHWYLNKVRVKRSGQFRIGWGAGLVRQIWPCKDGFVIFLLGGGTARAKVNKSLTDWMISEGMGNDFIQQFNWNALDMAKTSQNEISSLETPIGDFFLKHTKNELFEGGVERRVDVYPVNNCKDIAEEIQLKERGFWVNFEHPDLKTRLVYPGELVKSTEVYTGMQHIAPRIGEHNEEIYINELGLSQSEFYQLKQAGVI